MIRSLLHAKRYSRMISLLKLVLPLTALALLSMVFLLARPVDTTRAIEMAEIDVEERARDPRISGARFAGVTDDGAALRLVTETVRTDPLAMLRFDVTGLELYLDGPRGETIEARAEAGALDRGQGIFSMDGTVEISASPGYRLETGRMTGLLDNTRIEVPGTLTGAGPAGEITAGNLLIEAATTGPAAYKLVFGGGVRLIYQP